MTLEVLFLFSVDFWGAGERWRDKRNRLLVKVFQVKQRKFFDVDVVVLADKTLYYGGNDLVQKEK